LIAVCKVRFSQIQTLCLQHLGKFGQILLQHFLCRGILSRKFNPDLVIFCIYFQIQVP